MNGRELEGRVSRKTGEWEAERGKRKKTIIEPMCGYTGEKVEKVGTSRGCVGGWRQDE